MTDTPVDSILDQVRQMAADVFSLPVGRIMADASPATIENWDSVQQLNLVLALEAAFGLEFSPEDIEGMQSIGAMAGVVQKKLAP